MTEQLQQSDFAECLNDKFQVVSDFSEPFDLELISVNEEKRASKQYLFSILFHGPADKFMPQHIYKLSHPRLGVREIFLVPVSQDNGGFQYQAVFNYLVESS